MQQATALKILKQGRNVFLTGQAGSGKTYVLNQYIDYLRRHDIEPAITASTGIAATHIGGVTIHSWSGMGINNALTPELEDEILSREATWKRIAKTKVLIIDEISMVAPQFLEAIDTIARSVHENPDKPFGGIQVIVSGDFFQLPPIFKKQGQTNQTPTKRYAWQSQAWLDLEIIPCYLEEQHRQGDQDPLRRILEGIRSGEIEEDGLTELSERMGLPIPEEEEPVRLFTHNVDVDSINYEQLEKLESEGQFFEMTNQGAKNHIEKLIQGCLAPELLELREGAQVMFVRNNYEKNYVNGSLGTVVGFDETRGYPLVELYSGETVMASPEEWALEQDGKKIASISQVPLRLAWAITIHKSQGMSLDKVDIDLSKCFEVGQGYVALSRVTSMEGLYIRGFNHTATSMDPLTIRVDKRFRELSSQYEEELTVSQEEQEEREINWVEHCGGSIEEVEYQTQADKARESTQEITRKLLEEGKGFEEIAKERGLAESTIVGHVLQMKTKQEKLSLDHIEINEEQVALVQEAIEELEDEEMYDERGNVVLKPIFNMLDGELSYDDIKMALIHIL